MLYFSLLSFAFASLTEGAVSSCPKDNFGWALDNFCYEIVFKDYNWYDARNYCASRGGDLAEIRTQRIQNSIVQHLRTNNGGRNGFWFGASDSDNEGHWLWLHSPRGMAYSHWNPSQGPNDHGFFIGGSLEDCAMIRTDDGYRWHDGPCNGVIDNLSYSFICQYEYKPTPKPTTMNWVTRKPTTLIRTTQKPTTYKWTTSNPTTLERTTSKPTTYDWTTQEPTTTTASVNELKELRREVGELKKCGCKCQMSTAMRKHDTFRVEGSNVHKQLTMALKENFFIYPWVEEEDETLKIMTPDKEVGKMPLEVLQRYRYLFSAFWIAPQVENVKRNFKVIVAFNLRAYVDAHKLLKASIGTLSIDLWKSFKKILDAMMKQTEDRWFSLEAKQRKKTEILWTSSPCPSVYMFLKINLRCRGCCMHFM